MEEKERFVLRNEVFGGTLFDRKLMRHEFLTQEEFNEKLRIHNNSNSFEYWQTDTESLPKDIIYSPIRIYFEATKMCNLRCRHCFNSSGQKGENELDTKEIFNSLKGIRKDSIFDIRFTGGEFTQREDWFEILSLAKELGFAVSLNTNLVYEDKTIIDKLSKLNLNQVTASIDGTEEKHNDLRGKGTYKQTIENLRELHNKGVILRTNTVLTGENDDDIQNIIENVGNYVSEMNFFHMRPTGRAKDIKENAITYERLAKFNQKANDIVKKYPHINIMFGSFVARMNSIKMNQLGLRIGGPDGFTRFNLNSDGSIFAGGYAQYINHNLKLGNIKDEKYSMLKIWRYSPKLDWFRKFSSETVARCINCPELLKRCGGANIEMELIKLNTPEGKNPYCMIFG